MAVQAKIYSDLDELVSYRHLTKQRTLAHQQKLLAATSGEQHAIRKGRGMSFSEVRQYQAGDDIRHIDWKVTARTQKAHTKIFVEERERPTLIVTEQTPALFFGSQVRLKTSQALNLASILAWTSLHQNERVGGLVFDAHHTSGLSPKRSKHAVLSYLQSALHLQSQLQRPEPNRAESWHRALQSLAELIRPGSKIYLIGDMVQLLSSAKETLSQLSRHNDLVALHLFDPLDKELPELGWLTLATHFDSPPVRIDSFRAQTRQAYQAAYQTQWQQAQEQMRQLNIPLVEVNNHLDPLQQLLQYGVLH